MLCNRLVSSLKSNHRLRVDVLSFMVVRTHACIQFDGCLEVLRGGCGGWGGGVQIQIKKPNKQNTKTWIAHNTQKINYLIFQNDFFYKTLCAAGAYSATC